MGISQSLPRTGSIKMVDIWMIFTMSYPFLVITFYCILEVIFVVTFKCEHSLDKKVPRFYVPLTITQ